MEPYWDEDNLLLVGQKALAEHAAGEDLLKYLAKFQQGRLTTMTPKAIPSYAVQRAKLIDAMRQQFPEQGTHQTVALLDRYSPKFWELILSLHFVTQEIELTNNIGYDRSEAFPGLRSTQKRPYAEFTILGSKLKRDISKPNSAVASAMTEHRVSLRLNGLNLSVMVDGQSHKLRRYRNSNTYRALSNLYTRHGEALERLDLGLTANFKTALKDIPNNIGFSGVLRDIFIDLDRNENGRPTIKLNKSCEIDNEQYVRLVAELVNMERP